MSCKAFTEKRCLKVGILPTVGRDAGAWPGVPVRLWCLFRLLLVTWGRHFACRMNARLHLLKLPWPPQQRCCTQVGVPWLPDILQMRAELYDVLPEPQLDGVHNMQQAAKAAAAAVMRSQHHQQQQQQQQQPWPDCAVVQMHYCPTSQLLAMVFGDGSAALYSPTSSDGQLQAAVQFRRWLCGPAARSVP